MQAVNTVRAGSYNFAVKGKNRPFGNNFVVESAEVVQYKGQDEIACVVRCAENSKEPGRVYFAQFSTRGILQECRTLN